MTTKNKTDGPKASSLAFPANTVFAVFESSAAAKKAIGRLGPAGVTTSDVQILEGETGAQALDPTAERGLLAGLAKELSDVTTYLERYADRCRRGETVAAVPFRDDEERQTITSVLLMSGGSDLCYATEWTMTEVVQQDSGG